MVRPQEMIKSETDLEIGFTRIVEHTVMNSVAVIVTTLEALMRSGNLPADLFEMAHRAEFSARDLASRVNAISELFGSSDSFSRLRIAAYDAEQFLRVLVEQLNLAIGDKMRGDITFHMEADEDRNVSFDARRVSTILYHLIGNALRHGNTENKNIKVTYRKLAKVMEISVRDYGGGVPEAACKHLFTYQEKLDLKSLAAGMLPPRISGLGLPLCYKLAKDMGGDLVLKNFKTGAKFTLIIPQETKRMYEPKLFVPDSALMQNCMASVLWRRKNMTITYEFSDSLYVNMTNRCSNACTFCLRNHHDDVNGVDNLWLTREPTVEEIKEDFKKRDLKNYRSVVFCGYGEPTERFDDMIAIARWIKQESPDTRIRLNTNGQANLICGRDVTPEMKGCIDTVSISLNAENAEKYQERCKSKFGGTAAFEGVLQFASLAKQYVDEVVFSVVDVMDKEEIEHCRKIAEDCGVKFRVREYIA